MSYVDDDGKRFARMWNASMGKDLLGCDLSSGPDVAAYTKMRLNDGGAAVLESVTVRRTPVITFVNPSIELAVGMQTAASICTLTGPVRIFYVDGEWRSSASLAALLDVPVHLIAPGDPCDCARCATED